MSRYRVVHTSRFDYTAEVRASYNEARMTPAQSRGQNVLECDIVVSPCTSRYEYTDYWGTSVTAFEVLQAHQHLEIVAHALVDVPAAVAASQKAQELTWDQLRDPALRDRLAAYLTTSPATSVPDDVVHLARECTVGRSPHEAAEIICRTLREEMEYVPGVTTVHTPAVDAWAERKGVCQDIAHVTVGALRAVGIPALYVSGYYYPGSPDDTSSATVVGQSHAWVEWWSDRWHPFDPTNRTWVGGEHVVTARGREYSDVPPLKGVFAGGGSSNLTVTVEMTREVP